MIINLRLKYTNKTNNNISRITMITFFVSGEIVFSFGLSVFVVCLIIPETDVVCVILETVEVLVILSAV